MVDCQRETRSLLQQIVRGLRTVLDYERFEGGRIALHATALDLAELLHEVKEELDWQLNGESRPVQIDAPPAPSEGDRDLTATGALDHGGLPAATAARHR